MPKKAAVFKTVSRDDIVKAALAVAARDGWDHATLQATATEAGVTLAEMHAHFADRFGLLAGYGAMIDRKVLAAAGRQDPSLSPRDRLFDLLMERYDNLNDDRAGVVAVLKSMKFDPKTAIRSLPHLGRSMSWMLEAAGISTNGPRGGARILGLTAVYLATLREWLRDDSQDMSLTMAALDKNLQRAESWAGTFRLDDQ